MIIIRKLGKEIKIGDVLHYWTGNHRIDSLEDYFCPITKKNIKIAKSYTSKIGFRIDLDEYEEICINQKINEKIDKSKIWFVKTI